MPLTIAILAGGAATRLGGRDKGLEPLLGRPLVAWSLDAAAAMAPESVLIVANRHPDEYARYGRTIHDAVPGSGDSVIPARAGIHPGPPSTAQWLPASARTTARGAAHHGYSGPLAGVATALAACTTPWLLTLPVDCPDPPRDLAARLLAFATNAACEAVVAHDGARRQPLFALYRRELAESATAAATRGLGPSGWQDAIAARELDFADRRAQFRNLNTSEDFVAYAAERAR